MNSKKNILIIGATSGIAEAVARRYAAQLGRFFLVGRDVRKLDIVAADLRARGADQVHVEPWDASDSLEIGRVVAKVWERLETVDLALIAHGSLPDQEVAESDMAYAIEHMRVNGESAVVCMLAIAPFLEKQRGGTLAVIGSVAGDRGRASNYVYGAAKAAVATCASGLRVRLARSDARLLLIKPGFVATAMTAHLDLPARLTATPEQVAIDIARAVESGKPDLYTPWFWWPIMFVIRSLPTFLFNRMKL